MRRSMKTKATKKTATFRRCSKGRRQKASRFRARTTVHEPRGRTSTDGVFVSSFLDDKKETEEARTRFFKVKMRQHEKAVQRVRKKQKNKVATKERRRLALRKTKTAFSNGD